MRILGIDPGSRKAGFAIVDCVGRKIQYVASGPLKFDQIEDYKERLHIIYNTSVEIIKKYSPDEISIESLIYVKSPTSLMKLAQARGAMIAAFGQTHNKKVFEYSPNLVKSTVTGHGHATKESMQKGLALIFGKLDITSFDESDALGVAACHAFHRTSKLTEARL